MHGLNSLKSGQKRKTACWLLYFPNCFNRHHICFLARHFRSINEEMHSRQDSQLRIFTNLCPSFLQTQEKTSWLLYDYKNLRHMKNQAMTRSPFTHFLLTSVFQALQRASRASFTAEIH